MRPPAKFCTVSAAIAVVSDNGSWFRGETYQAAFAGDDTLLRHVRIGVRSPQTNGIVKLFFGT
jgi:putative transposase